MSNVSLFWNELDYIKKKGNCLYFQKKFIIDEFK